MALGGLGVYACDLGTDPEPVASTFEVAGEVRRAGGGPVAEAVVVLQKAVTSVGFDLPPSVSFDVLRRTSSDASGHFAFKLRSFPCNGPSLRVDVHDVAWRSSAPLSVPCGRDASGTLEVVPGLVSTPSLVALPEPARAVSAGNRSTCAVGESGTLYCWGLQLERPRGAPDEGRIHWLPRVITTGVSAVNVSGEGSARHACLLRDSGEASCWGWNQLGVLGIGTDEDRVTPTDTVAGDLLFTQITVDAATCGRTEAQEVWCWGGNTEGALGTDPGPEQCTVGILGNLVDLPCSRTPVLVAGGLAVRTISAVGSQVCALDLLGSPYCWGGAWGLDPQLVAPGLTLDSLDRNCGATSDGEIVCWGSGPGLPLTYPGGSERYRSLSSQFPVPSAFSTSFCAITLTAELHCNGQEANGGLRRLAVGPSEPVTAISVGANHACALTLSGAVYCWGEGNRGQLGI